MGSSTVGRDGYTREYEVDEYGVLDALPSFDGGLIPSDADIKVVGDEVWFRTGPNTLQISDVIFDKTRILDLTINTVSNAHDYTVELEDETEPGSTVFTFTSSGSATETEIADGLVAQINNQDGYTATKRDHGGTTVVRIQRLADQRWFTHVVAVELTENVVGTKGDRVMLGQLLNVVNLQRDLGGAAGNGSTPLERIVMVCRPDSNAKVTLMYSWEVKHQTAAQRTLTA